MAPFIVMLLSFLILRLTGVLGITYFDEWETAILVGFSY
jgi:hypothetical protein